MVMLLIYLFHLFHHVITHLFHLFHNDITHLFHLFHNDITHLFILFTLLAESAYFTFFFYSIILTS